MTNFGFVHTSTLVPFFMSNGKLWSGVGKLRITTATVFQSISILFRHKLVAIMPVRDVYTSTIAPASSTRVLSMYSRATLFDTQRLRAHMQKWIAFATFERRQYPFASAWFLVVRMAHIIFWNERSGSPPRYIMPTANMLAISDGLVDRQTFHLLSISSKHCQKYAQRQHQGQTWNILTALGRYTLIKAFNAHAKYYLKT